MKLGENSNFINFVIGVVICIFVGLMYSTTNSRCNALEAKVDKTTEQYVQLQQQVADLKGDIKKILIILELRYPNIISKADSVLLDNYKIHQDSIKIKIPDVMEFKE